MTESVVPMSLSQQGMYFDCQLRDAADYHVVLPLRIDPIPAERLVRAVRQVMDEQPALHSAVRNTSGGSSYVVAEAVEPPVTHHDLRGNESRFEAILDEATEQPFELSSPPLFRVVHCELGDEDRIALICHHLIADGQSVSLLAERLIALARAETVPETPVDTGFEAYQRQQTVAPSEKKSARRERFWRDNLARQESPDLSHWMNASTDGAVGRERRFPLDESLREVLAATAREAEVSEYTLYLAAFGLLLAQYAHTDHVSVATPFTDRPGLEMESSIGCFIKTLPVHIDADPQQSVRAMFERLSREVLGSWKHLGHPVAGLLSEYPALTGVYDVTFIQDDYPDYPDGVRGAVRTEQVRFPGKLTVLVERIGATTELVFQYCESALSQDKVDRLAQRYLALLARVPESLDAPVATVRSTVDDDSADLLAQLTNTHYFDWQPTHLGEVFLAKTTAEPGRVAWSDETRDYSNAWVHDAAVLVQHRILSVTGGVKQPVAVLLPRSVELPAGLLGTILAGCAYVPLAENTPTRRIAEILSDADISVVLTTSAARLELPDNVTRLDIDEWDEFAALRLERRDHIREQPTDVDRRPEDVLYVEYTSGSTGRPKGVVVRHANIQNTAMDLQRRFPLEAEDRYLLKTAVTFDIFGTELYGWLFGDGRLDILPVGYEGDVPALLDWIRERGVTHVNFTPTMLRVLLDTVKAEGRAGDLAGLRYLFSGGEALTADIVERFFALPLTCSLDNVYGPTEASMWATHTTVTAADTDPVASIGTPLNDYRVLILNPTGDLCGIDVPGEICIAGAGVAAGYLNRDELTADRFVTNPFFDPATDPEHMRRMYRTGDLGHLRADGRLAFIRRIDRQVKVGGVRMELGEIEQALLRTDGVLEAAVVVDDASTPPRLAGFYTGVTEVAAVRASLAESLLPHMIPSPLVKLAELPRSSAGKLDHRALTERLSTTRPTAAAPRSALQERVAQRWRQVLGVTDLDVDASFFEQGGNSLSLMSLQSLLREEFGRDIRITELLKHHSVGAQARLLGDSVEEVTTTRRAARLDDDVAIIGIGIQVPGADDVHQFWNNLRQGAESITFYDDEELRALGVPDTDLRDPNYVKAHGRIDGLNVFDDKLFAIPPAEVDVTSPQLRLLYKCFWQACEDAGYDPRALPGRVGVFAGGNDDFAWYQRALMNSAAFGDAYQNFTLATNHFLSTRLSYKFDLTGPSLSSLSGCSTSLLTVHQAAQSLRAGECDMAVAGGVTVELPNEGGYRYVDGMMLSPDGHCRPFDAKAAGTVFSNGAALLLLKPAADAIADGDPIYAVIKGSAVGNDGGRKPSYTAPSEDGQYETIRAAYDVSGIDPASIGYIEAHGTGTLLGDPIEVASLSRVFADTAVGGCVLGSVKGNVGHTDSAAGSVGLSKVALSLKHRYLPGTRNFETANPAIDVETGPFTMSDRGRAWRGERLRAGINSFGVGGTNVHMIVEEAPTTEMTHDNPHELLRFAAASPEALNRTAEQVVAHLARHDEVSVTDAARTLRGRAELPFRKSITVATGESRDGWVDRIASAATVRAADGARTALLFSGQGNQYHRMGYDLYRSRSAAGEIFRHWMDELTGLLPAGDAAAFADIVYGEDDDGRIDRTEWTQFALFSTQYAMTKVLESFGVAPDLLVGHSIGELTAAALAGVWSLPDAAHLVRERGKLMQNQPPGVMVAVTASADRIRQVVHGMDDVWVSLDNSVERSVLGMTKEAFGDVVDRLEAEGIRGSRLHTSNAFHTPMMTDAAKAFESILSDVESRDPSIPIISNRTGEVVRPGEMTDPAYWSEHITEQVRFTESLGTLMATGPLVGIELGPGRSLATFAGADPKKGPEHQFVTVMRHVAETGNDEAYLLNSLGTLWNAGLRLDWSRHDCGRRVSLPGYSFDPISHPQDVEIAVEPAPIESPKPRRSPATDVLQGIRDAFQYVLGYPEVAADADFFALGGDSLKATSLSAQLESRLGIEVSVADIFGSPTPAALAERFQHTDVSTALRKAPAAEDYPLSPAQTRMFIAAKLDPGQLIYNMPSATLLHGTLDPDRTRSALRRLVERHEPLRTTFVMRDGEVRQRVAEPPTEPPLRFTTRRNAVADLDAVLADFVKPFDLVDGPLFRMEIVDGGDDGGLLLFDIHHIVADATSVEMLTRDFSRLYAGDLDPLPLQYTDFVMHVHGAEHQTALAESEAHLLTALADPPTGDLLPTDHPRGEREPAAGRVELRLDSTKVAGVKALAETHNATPFMVTLSAWGAVLARYAERDDLIIGAPVTGRTMAETREMAGMFVNLMPIRLRPTAADSVTDYLTDSRARVLEALTHQDVPFDRLVERLNLPRIPGRHPLFDISFDYHNMDHHDVLIDGITAQPLELPPLAVGMDLVITCAEGADELTIHIDYAADLYERSTIEKLASHFDVLLERICEDTSRRVGDIPLYSDRQHAEVRAALTPAPFVSIHQSIADQVARDPQATAVIDPSGRRYGYAQLNAMADTQAARLRDAGLRTGDAVALFTVRDATLLIAQLAILKAGGCYVPLDPAQPRARLDRIIADARPRFAFAPKGTDAVAAIDTVIDLDTCREETSTGFTGTEVGPDDPIYTVYTSGSTGVPKGITLKHRGVANLLRDHRERRLFGPGDVIISLADPTFDIFTFESLIPLACGAAVHMCPVEDQKDAAAIAGRIADHEVSHIQAPVSKMTALCGNGRFRSQLARLRVVVCGGEHFPETLLSLLRNETGARLFNMYGPTETTVTATVKEFGPGDAVTIGGPIAGAAVLIVGDTGMIQPDGVPGELCIAGEGLAAGYPNNPEQTRRAFTTIAELPDVPVYRTGDAGMRLPDGDIVLKGRLDHQVKLNGNRIELGEIEKTAMRVDGVSYAVALVDGDDLVLCYTAAEDRSTAINTEISGSLPAYMKPGRLRRVADMPRLSNNKVDRNALRESPAASATPSASKPVHPGRSLLLDRILAVWQEVLGHPVRATDNFFEVGGTSYKLMLVNNRLGEEFGEDIPLVRLFENPTPASLAEALGEPGPLGEPEPVEPLAPNETETPDRVDRDEPTITMADLVGFDSWEDDRPAVGGKIAVIGMSGTFPGANTIAQHWDNRADGVVSIARFSREELLASGIDEATVDDPDYVNARGHIDADTFDADFFGYSAKDAETMDPQLRLLHETTWHALEDAGYTPGDSGGDIALFVGSGTNFAWMAGFLNRRDDPIGAFEAMTMNEKDFLATKIAYKLNLTGPAVNVQTACSTSLVAIHEAVRCLRQGDADMALAGGVALNFPRKEGYAWHEGMIFSRDGVCRPFSQDAEGTVAGQGCGVVLLKPLDRAIEDGDHIYAVIAGSAVNNDGNTKVGYTAPSVRGQRKVIEAALADAGVDADDVGYIETHGTGTKLGDPIEYRALSAVYGRTQPCALGAVKANIGHLDAAAGVAGFIGAVGVLHRGQIPPMANFASLNENIEPSGSLYVPVKGDCGEDVRMAAVSSFGIGGTNAHLVLEAAPSRPDETTDDGFGEYILPISARTESSRSRMRARLEDFHRDGHPARDLSHTLAHGRVEFESRAAALAVPGQPLAWLEPTDPPLAVDAADNTRVMVDAALRDDETPAAVDFRSAVEDTLTVFDDGLRAALRASVYQASTSNVAIERISQFVIRVALIRLAGPDGLYAPAGADRLSRIASAFAQGRITAAETMRALKSGTAPPAGEATGPTPSVMDAEVDARLLRRLLASRWVRHGGVDRDRFCANGKRLPAPGYAFEERRFVSDIRLDELGGTSAPASSTPRSTDPVEVLREVWIDVLGSQPADDADFLASGGDSLSAVHLCAMLAERTGITLTVGEVFADARYQAIARLLEQATPAETTPEPLAPTRSETTVFPASPAQKRMYAVCAMQNDTTAYNLAIAYRISGDLDVDRLREIFARLVERHDQLRTSFHLDGGDLIQRVHPEVPDVLTVVELTEEQARRRLDAEPRPFDLATAPLLRVEVLSVAGRASYLLIDMHHIIGDQRSLAVLAEDIAEALRGNTLPPPPTRYADYVAELERLEATGRFDADTDFFVELLRDDIPRLELPADRTAPEAATFDGDRHSFVCSADRRAIADLARDCAATPYLVFLTAITRLFGLYSGQREFVLGTAVSGRFLPGTDRTVGMFVNTLPVRVEDASERTVAEAVAASRDRALAMLDHQSAPFEAVLSRLDINPGGDAHPLFDVLFNYVNLGTEELELDGVRLEPVPPGRLKSRYALSLSVAERADDITVDIEYRTELFDATTIARLAGHLDHLLVEMTRDVRRRISQLSLETPAERDRRRAALTAAGPAIEASLLDRVRHSFTRHAEHPALTWERREWSYAELDELTDSLAGGLQDAGVGVGDFVLCLLERGPWQVISRIALLKCGAIEIPLDAATPAERIAHTLTDSGAAVVLCTDPSAHPWPAGVTAVPPAALTGTYRRPSGITAQTPHVMIYTSGTTGRPKGTLVPQGGLLSTCVDNGYLDYRPGDRVLHLTGYTFDPSLLDIYSAFLTGATLVMGSHAHNMDMTLLADLLREERVDKGILITAVFHLLMAENPEAVADMSAVYVGGEAMQPWAARRAFEILGPGRLFNLYGPTEASVCTTYFRVDETPDVVRMPIGVPARNRELFIVHPDGTDVPRGIPGELLVAGPSVAIGYHRRPELTAEKFPDAVGDIDRRLYRTGDRVVLDENDHIVYLDRIDQQVKHAGYRIELSEIELAVRDCAGVVEAVVIHTAQGTDSRLTAFYTGESAPAEAELRRLLLAKLPRYMVPQRLVWKPQLPLTSHGKVDRKLLAARVEPIAAPEQAPATADTAILTAFRDVLGAPDLSATDDFFSSGAQSLQAIAVVRRLRESGVDIQVSDVYRHPTAQALSALVRPESAVRQPEQPRRELPVDRLRHMLDWTVADTHRFGEALPAAEAEYGFDIGAVARLHRDSGADTGGFMQTVTGADVADLTEAVAALAIRHEVLRARLVGERFEILPPAEFEGLSALLPVRDLRRLDRTQLDEFVDELALALQSDAFDGLLWRCVLVRESDDAVRLVWAFHHGVFDGFSAAILTEEIVRLAQGEKLPDARRYSDFVTELDVEPDWPSELTSFDYPAWLSANRVVTDAVTAPDAAPSPRRHSLPLDGANPLELALTTVHDLLRRMSGVDEIAVAFVTNCRRWRDEDYSDCVGEFLDAVPVLLRGHDDQPAVAGRLAAAQDRGLHYVHSLSRWSGEDDLLRRLQAVYRHERGLDVTLVNFQGFIDADEMPETTADGPTLAHTHINIWHDDDSLHLEWIADTPTEAAGDRR
ncbi:amino acid adenylation domain-containing protein [Stackebrandtia endophytica]|uniref:Amino acid adenylation domain-containing protein n=1 Tax=Stackebrandtia endophytica TaxID=1496996 RepID=A0A543AVU0_9ACTN|nr:non-ribosomal peptide synthetase/type I polyketide synthase [Stackebrandtia endophytica]TQL76703.1 amino acid adenylation domain-containing protein [Stackebrandtia endophytica]